MKRQLNLYESRLRPQFKWATARQLSSTSLLLLVVLVALATWLNTQLAQHQSALSTSQSETQTIQTELNALNQKISQRNASPELAKKLAEQRLLLAERQGVLATLSELSLEKQRGFADYLFAFARQAGSDVWLTGLSLQSGGAVIELRGRLFEPAQLPAYVKRLSQDPLFQGRQFATLEMSGAQIDSKVGKPSTAPVDASTTAAKQHKKSPATAPNNTDTEAAPIDFVLRSANAEQTADTENTESKTPTLRSFAQSATGGTAEQRP
ncbi:MAG: hypothetical protein V4623_04900 [Pseudomonadota bacterium]